MPARATALFALLTLAACAPRTERNDRANDAGAGADTTVPSAGGAFSELNSLARQAAALKTPLAQYEFYRVHYEQSSGAVRGFLAQVLAANEAELGAYEQAVLQYPQTAPLPRRTPAPLPDPAHYRAVAAADGIAALARDRRIVLVNEAHHAAQTRVLTLALLPRLRESGFTHFAAEGLSEHDRGLAERGYPLRPSGPYIDEPLYGEIIRTALQLGFAVVPYESAASGNQEREEEQAQHLVDRVFAAHRDARLFVHAGYAHVHERPDYLGTDPMAMRLRRKTGVDPLVVDQTMLRPSTPDREYADYRKVVRDFAIVAPTIFATPEGKTAWSLEPDFYDVSVVLPPTKLLNGRPDWLALGGERIATPIGLDLQPASLPCVVEARYAGESDAAVPADRVLVERAGVPAVLFLRPGEYRVSASTASGHIFGAQRLRVARAYPSSANSPDQQH